jgi:ABC-2 type transport system permease protein
MHKVWLIFKREYVTRVKTKGFIAATIGIPIFSIGIFGFSIFMATRQTDHTLKIAIVDDSGGLAQPIQSSLNGKLPNGLPAFDVVQILNQPASEDATRQELLSEVNAGKLDGFLVLPADTAEGHAAEFHTRNTGDFSLVGNIGRAVNEAVVARRLSDRGVHVDNVRALIHGIDLKLVKVSKQGEAEEKGQTFLIAIGLAMLLYMTLIIYGMVTMRSVLEEKTSRIVEVLVSAVSPFQLLAGKITGVAAVAFTQYGIWLTTAALLGAYGGAMAASLRPGAFVPSFHIPAHVLVAVAIYFLLGYFLYAALYAAIGAAASNEQDAQQMQIPVTLPLVMSFIMFNMVLRDPNSTASVVLSEIPFFTPIVMLLRISMQTPPVWQIALSIALLAATTLGVVYFSARIYRVGILMYGKRPSVVEIFKWLKYS